MRQIVIGILLSLMASFPAFAADSGAELSLKGDQVFLVKGGTSTALNQDMFPAQPIDDTDMRFLGVGPDDAKEQGIAPGLYIFQKEGKPVAFAATDEAEFCANVSLSPSGKTLAMDAGMSLVRNWYFFSYPEMKALGSTVYYQASEDPSIIWVGDQGVVVSTMNVDTHGRSCGYDPCGPVSVSYYAIGADTATALLPGTDLCDYTLTGLAEDGRSVTASELCLPTAKDWDIFPEDKPVKAVSVPLP